MASGGKRGGGDRVLESRHLVGLFLGVVLLCGVFFTLGYVMGRTQYGGSVHAESLTRNPVRALATAPEPANTGVPSSPAPAEWDFYTKKGDQHLVPAAPAKQVEENPQPQPAAIVPPDEPVAIPAKGPAASPAKIAPGEIVLQVAALSRQSDAMAMAELLQRKRFPSFVAVPVGRDSIYRVQVGPYSDERAADAAKAALERDGLKPIFKR